MVDPRTKESRGFGFVTMESLEGADRCIKHLNKSILEGRVITVEKVSLFYSYEPFYLLLLLFVFVSCGITSPDILTK